MTTLQLATEPSRTEGSKVAQPGEVYTVRELLMAVSITSANDATVALTEYVAGTEGNFVRLMNRKAEDSAPKHLFL